MGGQQSWDTTEGSEKLGPSGGGGNTPISVNT